MTNEESIVVFKKYANKYIKIHTIKKDFFGLLDGIDRNFNIYSFYIIDSKPYVYFEIPVDTILKITEISKEESMKHTNCI